MTGQSVGRPSWAAILPFRGTSPELRRALELSVQAATSAGGRVVLAQQCDALAAERWDIPPARHCLLQTSAPGLRRGRLVNRAALEIEEDWLVLCDPNVLLLWTQIAAQLSAAEYAVQLISAMDTLARDGNVTSVVDVPTGRGAFAIRRDIFLAIGGLSEAFVGNADEGLELVRRLRRLPLPKPRVRAGRGTRVWTPRVPIDEAAQTDNKATRARLCEAIDAHPTRYLQERLDTSIRPDFAVLQELSLALAHEHAFRVTCATPPPHYPRRLPGELWAVTALFNPAGFQSRRANYQLFREGLARANVPLLTVELAMDGAALELAVGDADRLLQFQGGDALWQKERLLNLGIAALPSSCDKVVWLDADILFERDDWAVATAELLEQLIVVQPFSRSIRLLPGEMAAPIEQYPIGSGDHEVLHSMAYGVQSRGYGCLDSYVEHGHCGYAWAARRDVLQKHGLYEANILGNGDLNAAHAMYGGARYLKSERLSPALHAHLSRWADAFHQQVRGSVGYVDGTVYHLWHGKKDDRRYLERLSILIEHAFDPAADLDMTPNRPLQWSSAKVELHRQCRQHFALRREDAI